MTVSLIAVASHKKPFALSVRGIDMDMLTVFGRFLWKSQSVQSCKCFWRFHRDSCSRQVNIEVSVTENLLFNFSLVGLNK